MPVSRSLWNGDACEMILCGIEMPLIPFSLDRGCLLYHPVWYRMPVR